MNLFDSHVDQALMNQPDLVSLRMVVEKELLHHDILLVLSQAGILEHLTFMGGTCLRACYGSTRMSEDLDFSGGIEFDKKSLSAMADVLMKSLNAKYGLQVNVSEPIREEGNVDTWKVRMQTRPERRDMPEQRINIDICAVPSYQSNVAFLRNYYNVDTGTQGLALRVESREEIFADKIVAFALRPNRIKYRDLWDMVWLYQQNVQIAIEMIPLKLRDHRCDPLNFLDLLYVRQRALNTNPQLAIEYRLEMQRFLPGDVVAKTINNPLLWEGLVHLITTLCDEVKQSLNRKKCT